MSFLKVWSIFLFKELSNKNILCVSELLSLMSIVIAKVDLSSLIIILAPESPSKSEVVWKGKIIEKRFISLLSIRNNSFLENSKLLMSEETAEQIYAFSLFS